jgi:hypothetical protein
MTCKNPNSEISVEISETLETLGPKNKNAQKFNLKIFGGFLKESIQSMHFLSPASKHQVMKFLKK